MSDASVALVLGSVLWFAGGAGVVISLATGATLFAPFTAVLIPLGIAYCIAGVVWMVRA